MYLNKMEEKIQINNHGAKEKFKLFNLIYPS